MANSSFYSGTGTNPTDVDSITSSKTAAETAATNAATSEANAALSAVSASNSATDASNSASSISGSVAAAASSATDSANSATSSATSATEAANSASSASTSATSASTSATSATSSASSAADSALDASGSATQAAASAASASTSASNAATSEVNSATSAAQAAASATTAQVAAANTAVSTVSANVAYVQSVADNISDVETVSNNVLKINTVADNVSAILAANSSSTQAVSSAAEAASSATQAAASATSAATSASTATAAKDAALEALDNFDDRYLGQKASDPSLDNDGNALVAGALYFNTTDNTMKVYDGSIWVAAYASLSGALIATNNLSDVTDAATSRTNLGLGTAATTASTDYATAAQGTLADTSVQPNDSPTFGSITVTGTVDGRDVAADGIKLDGINQGVATTDSPTFAGLGVNGTVTADQLTVYNGTSDPDVLFRNNGTGDVTLTFRRGAADDVYTDWSLVNDSGTFKFISDNSADPDHTQLTMSQGDISFYEDTGTTAKFFWDASAERLGIGTSSPAQTLHLKSANPVIRLEDSSPDGIYAQIDGAGGGLILSADGSAGSASSFIGFRVDGTALVNEAMRIDSNGNVGIGTTSPLTGLYGTVNHISGTSGGIILSSSASTFGIGSVAGVLQFYDSTNASERMRIDSSGNLLVGKATTDIATEGHKIGASGQSATFTRTSDTPVFIRRNTASGDLVKFYQDGNTVGFIKSQSTYDGSVIVLDPRNPTYEGVGLTGGSFDANSALLIPTDGTGATSDGALDLGFTSSRFRNLYLSGGVYLGGTGSANHLDDYEEGTWTPSLVGFSSGLTYNSQVGFYTKIGNLVTATFLLDITLSSATGSNIRMNVPFTGSGTTGQGTINQGGNFYTYSALSASDDGVYVGIYNRVSLYVYSKSGSAKFNPSDFQTGRLSGMLTYYT